MTGSEDEAGAAGRGHVRAAHADREQVIETLKAAFTQGRLDKDEFDLRVSQAFTSRTYAELAVVTADIPIGLATARPPAPACPQGERPVRWPGSVLRAATLLYAGAWVFVPFYPNQGDNAPAGPLVFLFGPLYVIILTLCVAQMVASWREKRSGGQLPRRPTADVLGMIIGYSPGRSATVAPCLLHRGYHLAFNLLP